jgi:hypothetical protein
MVSMSLDSASPHVREQRVEAVHHEGGAGGDEVAHKRAEVARHGAESGQGWGRGS